MKKFTLTIVLFALVSRVYFSACTKCEIEKIERVMTTTMIKGNVYANLDFEMRLMNLEDLKFSMKQFLLEQNCSLNKILRILILTRMQV